MTREEIYNKIWAIAQQEVAKHGYQFSAKAAEDLKGFIYHGVFNNMPLSDTYNLAKIDEAERNMREICQELCRREHLRQRPARIVESRTFTETRFQFCPRYPFC